MQFRRTGKVTEAEKETELGAATSQAVTTQPEAPSSSSSTSAKAAVQPTTKGSGKAQSSIKTFLEGSHFGMMLTTRWLVFLQMIAFTG